MKLMDMLEEQIKKSFSEEQAEILIYIIKEFFSEVVKAKDFNELKEIVRELAEAQRRSEQKIEELAEAQRRSEQRIEELTQAQKELAEAQRRSEQKIEELTQAQKELAEAQRRSEQKIEELTQAQKELAEAQRRSEQRIEELAKAQKETEIEIKKLTEAIIRIDKEHKETRRMLGGISDTVGYTLENAAYTALPTLLKEDFGIEIVGYLDRNYVKIGDNYDEVNILGEGKKNGKKVYIIGEGKVNLSKREVDKFVGKVERLKKVLGESGIFKVIVVHTVHPEVEEYAYKSGIDKIYKSSTLHRINVRYHNGFQPF